jgi:phosphinothricin acetyltransferase
MLGYVYASPHRARAAYCWSVDVSVYTSSKYRRQGVGRALYTSLFACLRLQGLYNAYAGITLPNPGSVGLHESFGFDLVGIYREVGYKSGQWHDVGWWQMALQPRIMEPPAPTMLPQAVELDGWAVAVDSGLGFIRQRPPHR